MCWGLDSEGEWMTEERKRDGEKVRDSLKVRVRRVFVGFSSAFKIDG